jgi:hypothetical protein
MQDRIVFPLDDKKRPMVKDWQHYRGKAETPMIGVMVPKGVFIIDVDTYKGATTQLLDEALGFALPWDAAELQTTKNGGKHYAFTVLGDSDLPNTTDILGAAGIDTRSAGKGYIATGEGYEDLTFLGVVEALHTEGFFPELPAEVLMMLSNGEQASTDDLDDLVKAVAHVPLDLSEDEVAFYMGRLDASHAEDSSTWLKVMFGLYHQTGGSDHGWQLFDTFSKLCPEKYDEKSNFSRWQSVGKSKKRNPTTFATVIQLAGGNKVIVSDKFDKLIEQIKSAESKEVLSQLVSDASGFQLDEINNSILIGAIKKQFTVLTEQKLTDAQVKKILRKSRPKKEGDFYEDYVFITATGEYMHRETKTVMGPRAFDVKHSRDTPADADGNPQRATNHVDNKIECVHSGMYAPMFADVFAHDGIEYFNTYKPNTLERKPQGKVVDMVKAHIAHLLPDPIEQQLVINYLAHNVQKPGIKIFWAMILQGVQGDGKSFFAELMQKVLGQSNCHVISAEALDEKYTGWAEGCCMVFFEELKLDNYKKYETINKLKPFITNPVISVRKMHRDIYEAINTANYFALTNFKDALPIDDSDRRYCVLFSQWQSREKLEAFMQQNPNYYPDLYEAMRKDPGEVLDWLLNHKIPESFLGMSRAPATRAKEQMQDAAKSDDWLTVEDALLEFECDDINYDVVNVTKLQNMVTQSFSDNYRDFPSGTKLKNIMTNMGYHNIGRYKNDDRRNQTIYCRDDTRKAGDFKKDCEPDF